MSEPSLSPDIEPIESRFMRMGDQIVVEPYEGEDFEATVVSCLGWGLVHGVMDWQMRRVDDGERFTYGIHINAPVRVIRPVSSTPEEG
jgi:hypothetical protein